MASLMKLPVRTTSNDSEDAIDISMSLKFTFLPGIVRSFNIRSFCHLECDSTRELATPDRFEAIRKIYKWACSSELSDPSKYTRISNFKRYLILCDRKLLNPFSGKGIDSILGLQGELARQEKLAREPIPFRFLYPDGAEIGIKSTSANKYITDVKELLLLAGCSPALIEKYARRTKGKIEYNVTTPYSDSELHAILARVQPYFFSLAKGISEHYDKYGEIPQSLSGIFIGQTESCGSSPHTSNQDVEINLHTRVDNTTQTTPLPFNQMMASAYILFCYYTSFNDMQVRDIRHPISVVTQRKEGRTERYVRVRGYKARKGADVEAYFVGVDRTGDDVEVKGNNAGIIMADLLKQGRHRNTDGLQFIKTFYEISEKFNPELYGKLFYSVDSRGKVKEKFNFHGMQKHLVFKLGLLSDSKSQLSEYLSNVICRYLSSGEWEKISTTTSLTGFSTVSRELMTEKMKLTRVNSLAYAFVRSLTDIPLKGALIPLDYNNIDSEGEVEVLIKYIDGTEGKIVVPRRYKKTFQMIEARAETLNPLFSTKREITRPAYLLPMGSRSETHQWDGYEMPIRSKFLSDLGIGAGAYLLNITSRRVRSKNSDRLYTDEDGGRAARGILQHSEQVQGIRYVNGHPSENMRQISQGLSVIENISEGDSVDAAKNRVKEQLGIKVLAYEEWKKSKTPSNPNGVACNGKIDLVQGKNEHYAAQKFAEKNGIINDGEDITCFQYDLCIFCKNMQLIDDENAVYKLISFIDSLYDPIEKMPERAEHLVRRIERFESLLDLLPEETLDKAEKLFEDKGRYFLFN